MNKNQRKLPRVAIDQMVSAAEEISKREKNKTAVEIFGQYLMLMDKYSDYFFSDPWPKKFDYKWVTTFTSEDLDFINENEDEYVDRVLTVVIKKNISLSGYSTKGGMYWSGSAFIRQFILPELTLVFEAFKELVKTGINAREILEKLKEKFEDIGFIHFSFEELLEVECMDASEDLKASEFLELIHTKESYPECESSRRIYQWEKLKEKVWLIFWSLEAALVLEKMSPFMPDNQVINRTKTSNYTFLELPNIQCQISIDIRVQNSRKTPHLANPSNAPT